MDPAFSNKPADFLDVLEFTSRHFRLLCKWGLGFAIVTAALSLQWPNRYQAQAQLVVPRGSGGLSALGRVADLGFGFGSAFAGAADKKFFERLVRSRTMSDLLIEKFDLKTLFKVKRQDDARRGLDMLLSVDVKDDVIRIGFIDTDPQRAADVCNAAVGELQRLHLEMQTSRAHRKRLFLETRMAEIAKDLRDAEDQLRAEKVSRHVVEPKEQAKVTLEVAGKILAESFTQQTVLRVQQLSSSGASPDLLATRTKLEELQSQLNRIDFGISATSPSTNTAPLSSALLPLTQLPEHELVLSRATRKTMLYENLYVVIAKEFELSRIEEINDSDKITILDHATPPDRKHSPSRSIWVFWALAIGLTVGAIRCAIRDWADRLKLEDPAKLNSTIAASGWFGRLAGLPKAT